MHNFNRLYGKYRMHLEPEPVHVASISGFWRTSLQALEAVNKFGRDISFITYSGTMSHRSAIDGALRRAAESGKRFLQYQPTR